MLEGAKSSIISVIKEDEDFQFYWCIAAVDMDSASAATLSDAMIDLWVTIRSFAFASAWAELYKQHSHKTLQRSKGIKENLFTDKCV